MAVSRQTFLYMIFVVYSYHTAMPHDHVASALKADALTTRPMRGFTEIEGADVAYCLSLSGHADIRPAISDTDSTTPGIWHNFLIGLVVKASASRAEGPGFDSHLRQGDFSGLSHTSDFKPGTPVATLPGAWH